MPVGRSIAHRAAGRPGLPPRHQTPGEVRLHRLPHPTGRVPPREGLHSHRRRGCCGRDASDIGCSFREVTDHRCGKQTAHVLDHHELRLQRIDRGRHIRPEPRVGARCEAGLLAHCRNVLTGKVAAEDVHLWHAGPVDGRDVAEIRRVEPVVGEDAGDGFVGLGEPDGLGVEDVLDG